MQREFGPLANDEVDRLGREVTAAELREIFWREYIGRNAPLVLQGFETEGKDGTVHCRALLSTGEDVQHIAGTGNGPVAAFVKALAESDAPAFEVVNYHEHALSSGAEASAIAYIQIKLADGRAFWGAATDTSIELASIKAVLGAVNRALS